MEDQLATLLQREDVSNGKLGVVHSCKSLIRSYQWFDHQATSGKTMEVIVKEISVDKGSGLTDVCVEMAPCGAPKKYRNDTLQASFWGTAC